MNKRTVFFLPLLLLSLTSFAQIELGVKAGLSTSSLQDESFGFDREGRQDLRLALEDADYGYQLGLLARIPFGEKFLLQPELTFNTSSATYQFDDPDDSFTQAFKERYNDVNVPILLSYKLAFLRVNAGPVGHFFVNSRSDLRDDAGIDRTWETLHLGYALGVGLDVGPITLDVRYDGNFSEYGETFTFRGAEVDVDRAPRRWVGSVAWRF